MRLLRKPHPLAMFIAWFLVVFLVAFPKGGVKLGGIPITWGYLFLAISTPPLISVRLLALPLTVSRRLIAAILMILPIQVLCFYALFFYGIVDHPYAISTFIGIFFLPWIFLFVYPPFLPYIDGERLSGYFRWSIFFAAVWGIFLFILHPITGHFVEIPYLTVNAGDYGELELTKSINRGLFFKLISTYNNGNLYGVCTLMLLPLYSLLEPKKWRSWIVRLALLLTLSRSVWAGLIVDQLLSIGVLLLRQVNTFPRLYLGGARKRVLALAITVALIFASLLFNASRIAFLFDPNLGGRTAMFGLLASATFLPSHGVGGLQEILYASAIDKFGYAGGVAFLLWMLSPVLLLFVDSSAVQSPTRRAALKGLILYSFLAGIDGGFNFLPTMAFYWFIYMIYLFGWPTAHGSRHVVAEELPSPSFSGASEDALVASASLR